MTETMAEYAVYTYLELTTGKDVVPSNSFFEFEFLMFI